MTAPPSLKEPSREPFFGWWIVGATFTLQLLVMGPAFLTLGVLLEPIAQSLDVGRGPITLVASLLFVVSGLMAPVGGALTGTLPIRRLMYTGVVILSLGFALVATSQSIWMIYLGWGVLVAMATTLAGPLQCVALICNWFVRLRGRALGLSQLGITASGVVLPVVVTWLMLNFGWRSAAGVMAVVPALLLVPLIWFFAIERPQDRGQHPDGDARPAPAATDSEETWTFVRALKSRKLLLLTGALAGGFLPFTAVTVIFISHATDSGLSEAHAALAFSGMTASAAMGTFLFGALSDYAPLRLLIALALALMAIGLLGLLATAQAQGTAGLVLAGAVFGLGSGALPPLQTVSLGVLFGAAAVPRMLGLITAMLLPLTMLGAPLAGYISDATGSYDLAFRIMLGSCAASLIPLTFLRIPSRQA